MPRTRWKAKLTAVVASVLFPYVGSASAQLTPIPDGTLGAESSTISPIDSGDLGDMVEGGARRGNTLFHSFEAFHVDTGRAVYFFDPGVDNILSRVTGNAESQILGLLGVFGDADLFILNPNGIIFGENARLDLQGGSFLATTADLFELDINETESPTEPTLTIRPSAFLFNQANPAAIVNNARTQPPAVADSAPRGGLRVADGERITLLGGSVSTDGGGLSALGGRIEIGGLSEPGRVAFNAEGTLEFPDNVSQSNVSIANSSRLAASDFTLSGGSITITANELDITNRSSISAGTVGEAKFLKGQAGDITLNASRIRLVGAIIDNIVRASRSGGGNVFITADDLSISGRSVVQSTLLGDGNAGKVKIETRDRTTIDESLISSGLGGGDRTLIAKGNAGNIEITTPVLLMRNGATLQANTIGQGNAGDAIINATESVSLENSRIISGVSINFAGVAAVGDGGNIQITTPSLSLTEGAALASSTNGQGNGGDIQVVADTLSLSEASRFSTSSSGQGNAGDVVIKTQNLASFDQSFIFSNLNQQSTAAPENSTENSRKAGDIQIATGSLSLINGAQFQSSTRGRGNAGDVTIEASDRIAIEGANPSSPVIASSIFATTRANAEGQGGNVRLAADSVRLADNGLISTATSNRFSGGSVTIEANALELTGGGRILTSTDGEGQAGDINLKIADRTLLTGENRFKINDNPPFFSGLFASTRPNSAGEGGTVRLSTSNLQVLDQARIEVDSQGTGIAGDAVIAADTARLDNGRITAETAAVNGGNLALSGLDILLLRNGSLISTTAGTDGAGGNGGNIEIDAAVIVSVPDENNDINANAFSGSGGNIRIDTSGLFGLAARAQNSPLTSDISASSEQGIQGTVDIATPETEPRNGLTELPVIFADVSNQITQTCAGNRDGQNSEFVVTGRGGLPQSPVDSLVGDMSASEWVVLDESEATALGPVSLPDPELSTENGIVEAQGWVKENGQVKLVAASSTGAVQTTVACK